MAADILKSVKTEYTGVYKVYYQNNAIKYRLLVHSKKQRFHKKNKNNISGYYDTLREAAIAVDKYLISQGKEPVNILKKK